MSLELQTQARVFFAVPIGAEARAAATGLADALRRGGAEGVRWVRSEAYHLTLRFLGETPRERVASLAEAARAALASSPAFELRLGELLALPSPRRPRVVALAVEPEAPLVALATRLERVCVAQGFAPETRRFLPHLTLGRVRGAAPRLAASAPLVNAAFCVSEVVLFESRLGRGGARYHPVARLPLAPGADVARAASDSSRPSAPKIQGERHGTQL